MGRRRKGHGHRLWAGVGCRVGWQRRVSSLLELSVPVGTAGGPKPTLQVHTPAELGIQECCPLTTRWPMEGGQFTESEAGAMGPWTTDPWIGFVYE